MDDLAFPTVPPSYQDRGRGYYESFGAVNRHLALGRTSPSAGLQPTYQ